MADKPRFTNRDKTEQEPVRLKWHAVCVLVKPTSCNAAKETSRIRYLSKDAPPLPLANCPCPRVCACSYKHFEDRRGQPRRSVELYGMRRHNYTAEERRSKVDRRKSD